MVRTRKTHLQAKAARGRTRELTVLKDGATKLQRQQAEKHVARIISRHAIIRPSTQKYGLENGKFQEIFESMATTVYSELNVSEKRVKSLLYRYYLKDKNETLPDQESSNKNGENNPADSRNGEDVADVICDAEEVSLCYLGGFYKTLFCS